MENAIHWFRRDFRIHDNTALSLATRRASSVIGVFIIDDRWFPAAMGKMGPHQATFWLDAIRELKDQLAKLNIPLRVVRSTDPVKTLLEIAATRGAQLITFNKDYEPYQLAMDRRLAKYAAGAGIEIAALKDAVIFDEFEILTGSNNPYTVFTPYKKAWLAKFSSHPAAPGPIAAALRPHPMAADVIPTAEALGYAAVRIPIATGESGAQKMLGEFADSRIGFYKRDRDYPAITGISLLSAHLSAGTISVRQCVQAAAEQGAFRGCAGAEHWLSEIIWREFYKMVIFHFPHTVCEPFQHRYRHLQWSDRPELFEAWKQGQTGYPIVDAAIRQIRTTGLMHNRLRMITAMFLTKDLDTHWRLGERQFMRWLMDYDQASNVGGWQWSAGTGTDAAPYFRIMNPVLQGQRYDPLGKFVRSMLPELATVPDEFVHEPWRMDGAMQRDCHCIIGEDYPAPIVDHGQARAAAIAKFQVS